MSHWISMKKSNKVFVFKSFIFWRVIIFLTSVFAVLYLPRFSENFFGGKLINYLKNPLVWGHANFDGEHYLSIAFFGYKDLQQAFFPLYPFLIKLFSFFFGKELFAYTLSGIFISNILFLLSLFLFWKVIRLDYSEKIAKFSTIALLVFPTSFFFSGVYTESLFLFLSLLTYLLYRQKKYLLSGLVGILMTATRIYGLFVVLMILIDVLENRFSLKKILKDKIYLVLLSLLGLFGYMVYLKVNYSDPLAFYTLQTLVGEQHQRGIVLLPQVFYRYLKILITSKMPLYSLYTWFLEVLTASLFVFVPIYGYLKKVKLSYLSYVLLGFLVPSIQGSFSSVPRYLLVIFPAFIIIGQALGKLPKFYRVIFLCLSAVFMLIGYALFFRGYFVS